MAAIRNQVPYEVRIFGYDITTNKTIDGKQYLKNALPTAATAYGAAIPGSGSTTTLLGNVGSAYEAMVAVLASSKLQLQRYEMRAILGYDYPSVVYPINALVINPTSVLVSSAVPHGRITGDLVKIAGVTTPAAVNTIWSIAVLDPFTFEITITTTGPWSNNGQFQWAHGLPSFTYADLETLITTAVGGIAGDALPINTNYSIRRHNLGTGKSFRSRFSVSPIPETVNDFGKIKSTEKGAIVTALNTFNGSFVNGGSEGAASGLSFLTVFSKKLAKLQSSPFTVSSDFSLAVTTLEVHDRFGSQQQRKPKVSGV
jgi:hypothetical protein